MRARTVIAAVAALVACVFGATLVVAQSAGDTFEADCSASGALPTEVGDTFDAECVVTAIIAATTTTAPTTSTSTTLPPTTTAPTTTGAPTTTLGPTTTPAPPAGVMFAETFDTAAGFYNRFWTHTGNSCSLDPTDCKPEDRPDIAIQEFPGSHDMSCAAPPTQRTVDIESHANLFWWCAPGGAATGHVMTGLNSSGYAVMGFAPAQLFTDVSKVCWNMSLADLGGGKWANVVLVPRARLESHPNLNPDRVADGEGPWRLDYVTPGFDPQNRNGPGGFNNVDLGVHPLGEVTENGGDGTTGPEAGPVVGFKMFRGTFGVYTGHDMAQGGSTWTNGTNESTRFRHCFEDLGNGTLRVTQNRGPGVDETFTTPGAFPDGEVAVIFQDDTYDADKHNEPPRPTNSGSSYTWHWDAIEIS